MLDNEVLCPFCGEDCTEPLGFHTECQQIAEELDETDQAGLLSGHTFRS